MQRGTDCDGGVDLVAGHAEAAELSESEAILADATIIAADNGWVVADVLQMLGDQETFGSLAEDLMDQYPNDFSSAVFGGHPGGVSYIYFKSAVPTEAFALANSSGLNVRLRGYSGKNHTEWLDQVDSIASFLESEGVPSFYVAFDDVNTIDVTIGVESQQAPVLPANLADDTNVTVVAHEPFDENAGVRGGSWLMYGSSAWCTTAFSVEHRQTRVTGFVTAEHCSDGDGVKDILNNTVVASLQDSHYGENGDVAWYSTPNNEPPKFFSSSLDTRTVSGVKQSFWRGTYLCTYGRARNVPWCDEVYRTSMAKVGMRRMVVMKGHKAIDGDSGGAWYIGTKAAGIHSGGGKVDGIKRSFFSKAHRLDNAMDVDVRVAP